ncbi:hypothetical protein [Nostoc commune]|uniref:hypothetical protein n=1 Tax=Nostoc commune TaxID=1178 RepID=UPI0018C5E595|nr:hypothetical protein [Nostoc commune]
MIVLKPSFEWYLPIFHLSRICLMRCKVPCKARSFITGIPKGRFSSVPGLGIQTRRVGLTFDLGFNLATSSYLSNVTHP